jgi:uncharacterized protein YcsI (UPF0317 family)
MPLADLAQRPAASWPAASARDLRLAIRTGNFTGHTSGAAARHVQGNVVILPASLADDFQHYCGLNAQACPLLAMSGPGEATLPALGADLDIRTDVPRYRVFRAGAMVDEPADITKLWRDDLVTFVLGCSFTFEQALLDDGIPLRHVTLGRNVAMYRTNVPTIPAGAFHGPMVVSMRPLTPAAATRATTITAKYSRAHGAPFHIGAPEQLGIHDLSAPDYGDAVPVEPGEVAVFWACGVTPQAAIAAARLPFCITHAPGCMLVTDLLHRDLCDA